MMTLSPRRLMGLAVLVFIGVAIATAPASLIALAMPANTTSFQYKEITGSIWNGKIKSIQAGEIYLGDIEFSVKAHALATGRLVSDVKSTSGVATGQGTVGVSLLARSVSIRDADFEFNLSTIRRYTLFGIPYEGAVRGRIAKTTWNKNGCGPTVGSLWTDALNSASRQFLGDGLILTGPAECDANKHLRVLLSGANDKGDTQIAVAIAPDFTYQITATVTPTDGDLRTNLGRLGFEAKGARLTYDAVGTLKGAGS